MLEVRLAQQVEVLGMVHQSSLALELVAYVSVSPGSRCCMPLQMYQQGKKEAEEPNLPRTQKQWAKQKDSGSRWWARRFVSFGSSLYSAFSAIAQWADMIRDLLPYWCPPIDGRALLPS